MKKVVLLFIYAILSILYFIEWLSCKRILKIAYVQAFFFLINFQALLSICHMLFSPNLVCDNAFVMYRTVLMFIE